MSPLWVFLKYCNRKFNLMQIMKKSVNDDVEIKIRVAIDIMAYSKYHFWYIGVTHNKNSLYQNDNKKNIHFWNCESSEVAKRIMKHFVSLGMSADCDTSQEGIILYAYYCT